MTETDHDKTRRHLPLLGIGLTVVYLVGLAVFLWSTGKNPTALATNELGDFLGGASSPLAFLWVVLGFFQQSRETRLSSEVLKLQAEELRTSLDDNRRAVERAVVAKPQGDPPPRTGSDGAG